MSTTTIQRTGRPRSRAAAGAVVRRTRQGKGHVMRRMFADIDADIYIMVDGDNTYDAASAPALVAKLREGRSTSSTAPGSRRRTPPIAPATASATGS